ncbi:hypothetical protein [Stenotrophomonas maltophilia]|uniref:hypothetical protein n=1 Tax=Stenotrophomonas maltophilia TaxID=40324 RepID=UPI0020A67629|nr:hypothetical protein [Stenotrophomonas maltophilia]
MSGLTDKDIRVLSSYAKEGNRELYWNYLAQLPNNDGYGLLALGVVRNDSLPGRVANSFATAVAEQQATLQREERSVHRTQARNLRPGSDQERPGGAQKLDGGRQA